MNVHITATAQLANTTCNRGAAPRGRFVRYAAREIAALYPEAKITWEWVTSAPDFGITITPAAGPEVRYQIWATLHDAAQTPSAWEIHTPPPQPAPPPKPAGFVVPRSGFTPIVEPTVCHPAHVMLVQDDDGASRWIEVDDDEAPTALRSGFVTGS